jgi:hypothetical protein
MRGLVQANSEDSGRRRIGKQPSGSVPEDYCEKARYGSRPGGSEIELAAPWAFVFTLWAMNGGFIAFALEPTKAGIGDPASTIYAVLRWARGRRQLHPLEAFLE